MVRLSLIQLKRGSGIEKVTRFFRKIMANRDIINFRKNYTHGQVNLRVLLDMDQVLCDFEAAFLQAFREKHPDEPFVALEDRRGFWLNDQYADLSPGITAKVAGIYNTKGFFKGLPELPGAIQAAKEMEKMEGVDVFICTSPTIFYKYCVTEKFQWIDKHLGPEWVKKMILTKDKTMANGHLLIDDKTNITGANPYPSWEHVVFSACHNIHSNLKGKRRLDNWTDGTWKELIEDFKKKI